jgi:hypothetical protein
MHSHGEYGYTNGKLFRSKMSKKETISLVATMIPRVWQIVRTMIEDRQLFVKSIMHELAVEYKPAKQNTTPTAVT